MTIKHALFVVAFLVVPATLLFQPTNSTAQEPPRHPSTTHTIHVGPNSLSVFSPTVQTVNVNDTVNWEWASAFSPHSTTSGNCSGFICTPDGKWESGVHTAPFSFNFQFTTPGTYPYYCSFHGSMMQGTIVVVGNIFLPLVLR
ncbi:MAG: hypothetical protein HZB51_16220 [Chloroflexi bacterium]|nr:hypothetical protein [Chloroflexota bacterium]